MSVEVNPHLPPAPADGRHDFGGRQGGRCAACGAYFGSPEASERCLGAFKESGKMRGWAAQKWARERAAGDDPQRVVHTVVRIPARRRLGDHHTIMGGEHVSIVLACGCERHLTEEGDGETLVRLARFGDLDEAACVTGRACAAAMERESLRLNPHLRPEAGT